MKSLLKPICALLVLILFGCGTGETQAPEAQEPKAQENVLLTKDDKPVKFESTGDSVLTKLVATPYSLANLIHKLKNCADFYCSNPLGENKIYRRSRNSQYYIQYDPVSTTNTLFDFKTNEALASIKLEANNPEFSIETIPLEDEPGVLLTDGIYGFTKYELKNEQFVKTFKINFDKQWQHEKFIVLNESNSLLVLKRNLNKSKAFADFYSLKDGTLLFSKPIDNKYKQVKYFHQKKVLVFFGKNEILLSDTSCKTTFCKIPASVSDHQFYLNESSNSLNGIFRSPSGFSTFECQDSGLQLSKYLVQNGNTAHQFFDVKNHQGALYSKFKKEGNSYKLLQQGLIVINKTTEKNYNINLPIEANTQIAHEGINSLICRLGMTSYLVDFKDL